MIGHANKLAETNRQMAANLECEQFGRFSQKRYKYVNKWELCVLN